MDENQQAAPEQQKSTSPLLIVGIIVVIVVIAGAFWLTGNQSKTTQSTQASQTQETVTTAPTVAATETISETATTKAIAVEGGNFYFKPTEIRVKKGDKVIITFSNAGGMHNFVISEFNVRSETISNGVTTVEFIPDKTGTFEFYCSVANHRQMGMKGKLIVE